MTHDTRTPSFELGELDLGDLTVTSMRDTVALPEGGASHGSCSCQGSSSCAQPTPDVPSL
ncbi:thiazolylpeptide-type bacteriocin [Streptomyces sp. NPDC002990]